MKAGAAPAAAQSPGEGAGGKGTASSSTTQGAVDLLDQGGRRRLLARQGPWFEVRHAVDAILGMPTLSDGCCPPPLSLSLNRNLLQGGAEAPGAAAAAAGIRLLVGVVSACCSPLAAARREAIRQTWARLGRERHPNAAVLFFLAQPENGTLAEEWAPALEVRHRRWECQPAGVCSCPWGAALGAAAAPLPPPVSLHSCPIRPAILNNVSFVLSYVPHASSHIKPLAAGGGAAVQRYRRGAGADFCGHGSVPARWAQQVPATHPFIFFTPALGRWQVRTPS